MFGRRIALQNYQALRAAQQAVSSLISQPNKVKISYRIARGFTTPQTPSKLSADSIFNANPHPKILITEGPCFYILNNIKKIEDEASVEWIELIDLGEEVLNCHRHLEASGAGLVCLRKRGINEKDDGSFYKRGLIATIETMTTFIVCNPLTKEWVPVPVEVPAGQCVEVLAIYFHGPSQENRMLLRFTEPASYAVVSVGTNRMKIIKNPEFETWRGSCYASDGSVLMHGNLHWFGGKGLHDEYKLFVVIYNLETEQFTHFPAPENFYLRYTHLVPVSGHVCILNTWTEAEDIHNCDVWVLADNEKGVWVKKKHVLVEEMYTEYEEQEQTYVPVNRDFQGEILVVKQEVHDVSNPDEELVLYRLRNDDDVPIPLYNRQTIDYHFTSTLATMGIGGHHEH